MGGGGGLLMGGGGINTVKVSPLLVTVGVASVVFTEGATVCLDGLFSGTLVGTIFSGEQSDSFSLIAGFSIAVFCF